MQFKIPWHRFIRAGIPRLVVTRRALRLGDITLEPGQEYPAPKDPREAVRCRQYYEARRIGPAPIVESKVDGPKDEKKDKQHGRIKK